MTEWVRYTAAVGRSDWMCSLNFPKSFFRCGRQLINSEQYHDSSQKKYLQDVSWALMKKHASSCTRSFDFRLEKPKETACEVLFCCCCVHHSVNREGSIRKKMLLMPAGSLLALHREKKVNLYGHIFCRLPLRFENAPFIPKPWFCRQENLGTPSRCLRASQGCVLGRE